MAKPVKFDVDLWLRDMSVGMIAGGIVGAVGRSIVPGPGTVFGAAAGAITGFVGGAVKHPFEALWYAGKGDSDERASA